MTKKIQPQSGISGKQNKIIQNKKYTCGCNKTYTSYPAYSTHRKLKHNNIDIEGTIIPKPQNPKRGRPSYEFVKKSQGTMEKLKSYYQSLTVIQLGLLKLNQRFQGKIISQSHSSNQFCLPEELVTLASHDSDRTKCEDLVFDIKRLENQMNKRNNNDNTIFLAKLMILFVQLMTTHMTRAPAMALIDFITQFIICVSEARKLSIEYQGSPQKIQEDGGKDVLDITMFNKYFTRIQNKEEINKICMKYGLRASFFVDVSIILSHWMYKLGYCEKVIKIRSREEENLTNLK